MAFWRQRVLLKVRSMSQMLPVKASNVQKGIGSVKTGPEQAWRLAWTMAGRGHMYGGVWGMHEKRS